MTPARVRYSPTDPYFHLHLATPAGLQPAFAPLQFAGVEEAYYDVCAAIPTTAGELLCEGIDPLGCSYLICTLDDELLMDVPFDEIIGPRSLLTTSAERAVQPKTRL